MNIQMAGVLIEADDEVGERQGAVRDSRVMLHPPKKPNHRTQKRCISQARAFRRNQIITKPFVSTRH